MLKLARNLCQYGVHNILTVQYIDTDKQRLARLYIIYVYNNNQYVHLLPLTHKLLQE